MAKKQEAEQLVEPAPDPNRRPMEDAPLDGTMVVLIAADGRAVAARYYKTRRRNAAARRWEPAAWWCLADSVTHTPVDLVPVAWRPWVITFEEAS